MPQLRSYDLSNVSREDLAYIAGFIDGDGCFYIGVVNTKTPKGNTYKNFVTSLKISNNDPDVLLWIKQTVGGTIEIKKTKKDKYRNAPCYSLWIGGNLLTDMCKLLIPFLKVRKEHAKIMHQMRETYPRSGSRGCVKPSDDIQKFRSSLCIQLHQLNSRFKDHPLKNIAPCDPPDLCSKDFQVN